MRASPALILAVALQLLPGCAIRPQDFGRAPELNPVGSGLSSLRLPLISEPPRIAPKQQNGSIWRDAGAELYRDTRAMRAGDVITVRISIKDKATLDNNSQRSRDARLSTGGEVDYAMAFPSLSKTGKGSLTAGANGSTSTDSKGAITRSESIELMVAAVVSDVLPNGNLVISGSQEVRVNFDVRELSVAGIVRPRDISTENIVSYDKIAEARISYGGRGRIMEVQQPGLGQQLLDQILPF